MENNLSLRYAELEKQVASPLVRSPAAHLNGVPSMTGKSNIPEVPAEPWFIVKKRELESDRRLYDDAIKSLTDAIGEERRASGLAINAGMPTSAMAPRMRLLQLGLIQLSRWHSDTLAALSQL